eukprot:Opistho-2@42024
MATLVGPTTTITAAAASAAGVPRAVSESAFTCIACRVAFADAEQQRTHYRTDWHRYNLKRKVAEMGPVTAENFDKRVLAQRADAAAAAKQQEYEGLCEACGKSYGTENAYNNHLNSKKHKDNAAKHAEAPKQPKKTAEKAADAGAESVEPKDSNEAGSVASQPKRASGNEAGASTDAVNEDDLEAEYLARAVEIPIEECLFCGHHSKTLEDNVDHMTHAHSFFIPDIEYLVDLAGLIKYLGEKVGTGNMCLYCNGKGRALRSVEAARKHMIDKGHCKMVYEGDAELEYTDFYDFRSSYPDYDPNNPEAQDDNLPSGPLIAEDETELVLPNGGRVGHRQFKRFYRQKFRPEADRQATLNSQANSKMIGDGRDYVLHWHSDATRRDERNAIAKHLDWKMRLGVRTNKFQRFFRLQIDY